MKKGEIPGGIFSGIEKQREMELEGGGEVF